MTNIQTAAAASASSALPSQWEASLEELVQKNPDLETLHGVNVAKLLMLVGIHDQLAAIAGDLCQTRTVELDSKTIDPLAAAMSRVVTADFERQFAHVEQRLAGRLTTELSKEIETLKASRASWAADFRLEVHERLERMENEILRLGLQTKVAVAENETIAEALEERQAIVEDVVAELAADREKAPPAQTRARRASEPTKRHRQK
jgi:hypothetical protein